MALSLEIPATNLPLAEERSMRILLFILAVLALLSGLATFGVAKSAVHEIEAYMQLLISAVFVTGAGIIEAINRLRTDVMKAQPTKSDIA